MFAFFAVASVFLAAYAQNPDCDFQQNVQVGRTYYVSSPNYPNNYPRNKRCRWIGVCPSGYNCLFSCSDVSLPLTAGCTGDRLLVSRTGDPGLVGADPYCGSGTLNAVSIGQNISIGFVSTANSPGARGFSCTLTAQPSTPPPSTCKCGYKKSNRIVGGQETGVNEFTMMAAMVDVLIRQIQCGAVIINPNTVLTAAHCLVGKKAADYGVLVGEHDVNTGADSSATQLHRCSRFLIHPNYSSANYDNDGGLAFTATPIRFSELVGPVCLPFKFTTTDFTNKYVTLLGWGTLFPGGPTSSVPMKVDVQVISQSQCLTKVPTLTDQQICTYTPGKDACQFDSGGPVLHADSSTGRLYTLGVVSFGRSCASGYPGVNTRLAQQQMLSWIVSNAPYAYCNV